MIKRKVNLISALTINHESARVVFWNYVKGFLEAKKTEENIILVSPREYKIMLERMTGVLELNNIKVYTVENRGRFIDRFVERNWAVRHGFEIRSFLTAFPCVSLVDSEYEYFINQNPEIYNMKYIWKTLSYYILISVFRWLPFFFKKKVISVRLSVSNYIEDRAKYFDIFIDRSLVLHSGHDIEIQEKSNNLVNSSGQVLKFVALSSFVPHKNVEETISLMHFLKCKGFAIELSLIGAWPDSIYREKVQKLIVSLNLTDVVTFCGRVSEQVKKDILRSSNFYVSSSKMESFGLPILEAEACGLLCIVKGGNGMSEVLSSSGCVYKNFDDVEGWLFRVTDNKQILSKDGILFSIQNMESSQRKTWKEFHVHFAALVKQVENHLRVSYRKPRATFLWSGFPDYAARSVAELAKDLRFDISVIATSPKVPIKGMDRSFKGALITLPEKSHLTWAEIEHPLPDVLFVCGYRVAEFQVLLKQSKRFGSKVVFMTDQDLRLSFKDLVLRPSYHLLLHRKNYDYSFVPGKSSRKVARTYGYSNDVIKEGMYGADPSVFFSRSPMLSRKKKIVFIGQLIQRKRVLELCSAFIAAINEDPSWTLEVYGSGPLSDLLPYHEKIHYYGFVQPVDLGAILGSARVLALPSDDEHWGVVVHEAALSGCALLTTSVVGANLDFCSKTNSIVIAHPAKERIYEAIVSFMKWRDIDWTSAYDESIRVSKSHGPVNFRESAAEIIENLTS